MNLLTSEDVVGIVCKNEECGVFISIRGMSKDNTILFVSSDDFMRLDKCVICGLNVGFETISHIKYHAQYLDEEELCDYCGK